MSTVLGVQRRMMELGRIRMGDKKGSKGSQQKLTKFRLTSASQSILSAAAKLYGGEVQPWEDAPDEGYFELYTEADELDIILPPVYSSADGTPALPYSQWFELWSAAGCARRCDGITESLSGDPCLCDPEARECDITTRLSVMLPRVPGIGTWLLQSKGWNAATVLPGTLDVLLMAAAEREFIPAILRLEQRTKKVPGEGTRKFVVPVIDVPGITVGDMLDTAKPAEVATRRPAEIAPGPPPPNLPEPTVEPVVDDIGEQIELPEVQTVLEVAADTGADTVTETVTETEQPAEGGQQELATEEDRRGIFEIASAKSISDARVKELIVEASGQESTSALTREQVHVVTASLMAEPDAS